MDASAVGKLQSMKSARESAKVTAPPVPAETPDNLSRPDTLLVKLAREKRAEAEPALVVEEPKPAKAGKGPKGRPPLHYQTRQLGARVSVETFKRVQEISKRERVGLGPLVDRMVAAWERQRLAEAEAISPRREGEDDDTYIARVFKL